MTKVQLLEAFKAFTQEATKDLIFPVRVQRVDEEATFRSPDVYLMRLPDGKSATKYAPYVLHQLVTGADKQQEGEYPEGIATVRSIMCVYSDDEQEGGMMLLNLSERLRIQLLKQIVIGNQFELDLTQGGLEFLAYPDDTAPYFIGEMMSVWKMPPIKREVPQIW